MLNIETKRHIDSARQVLVGKVPDPKSQIEQITNALIYKFMDDMDARAIAHGGQATFFTDNLTEYSWSKLMDRSLGAQDRMNRYDEALRKFGTAKQLPPLFRTIFKEALLPFKSPETLNLFLSEITYFNYKNSEELGNAFEYLLSTLGTQGDAGQFRTPRHIIDFIVDVIDPKKTDTILDPACGTAGFLISAFKHIAEAHDGLGADGKSNDEKRLTPIERKKIMENITGYDISPDMVRLSLVNMYLHGSQYGLQNPNIIEYDTLSQTERWDEKFDVILANPPFMTPKGGVMPHNKFEVNANRAEVLFVDYIKTHLKPNGRAGIIIPEGVIFQSSNAYIELRKLLVEDGLYAVVSLPSGVFNPYSGVKTSVLFFDNTISKQTKKVLFIKIDSDGYDLGAQRREINKNDLPKAIKLLKDYKNNSDKNIKDSSFSWVVNKSKILESDDCSLMGERYKTSTKNTNEKWDMVELGDVLDYEQPTKYIVSSVDYDDSYKTPVLTAGKTFILGYTNEEKGIFKEKLPVIIFDDFTTALKYVDFPFKVKSSAMKMLHVKKEKADIKYVFNIMKTIKFPSGTHKRYWISQYSKIKIPLPPLEIQKEIVSEIEKKQSIIDGAKELIQKVERERAGSGYLFEQLDCEWIELGKICETSSGGTPLKSKPEYYKNGTIPWLKSGEVDQGLIYEAEEYITKEALKKSSAKLFPVDTVLVAMYGATAGKVGILKIESSTNQAVCGILPNDRYIPEFLYFYLRSQTQRMVDLSSGGGQPNISQAIVRNLKVPLPTLAIQKMIIEKMEKQDQAIMANQNLIDVFEDQIKDIVNRIFEA